MPSKVYFANMRTNEDETLPMKLQRLMKAAGFETMNFKDQFVAVKMHFGEIGNFGYLRPNWARAVADYVRKQGGIPFLTDCNTLYVGGRKNALDHLTTAEYNGFNTLTTGCHVLIGDGLKGNDEVLVPVEGGELVKEAKIGRVIMDADAVISLTHFKGHELMGFGGALKNLGMGCGSRAGKMEMHNAGKPKVSAKKCVGCGTCTKFCANQGVTVSNRKAHIDPVHCVGCGRCIAVCPKDAIYTKYDESMVNLGYKVAEYTKAVVQGRPHFHIALAIDISPNCDCHAENDASVVPDVGMFASFDPVALDRACADAVNAQPIIKGTELDNEFTEDHDHFHRIHPVIHWESCLEHAEKIGIGTQEYELIEM